MPEKIKLGLGGFHRQYVSTTPVAKDEDEGGSGAPIRIRLGGACPKGASSALLA